MRSLLVDTSDLLIMEIFASFRLVSLASFLAVLGRLFRTAAAELKDTFRLVMSRDSPKILIVKPGGITNLLNFNDGANARSQIKLIKAVVSVSAALVLLYTRYLPDDFYVLRDSKGLQSFKL